MAPRLHGPSRGREGEDRQGSRCLCGYRGLPKREDHRGRHRLKRLRRSKNVKGRKRHLLVYTLGLPLSVYVTPANVQDRAIARLLLAGLGPLVPRLKKIWADGAYSGKELARWCEEQGGWEIEVVKRDKEAKGFEVLPKRWIVERMFGWLRRDRRLAKDYERKVQTSETLIEVAMIRLMLRRLAKAV